MTRPILLIPALNEAPRLADLLGRIRDIELDFEVVVVDDGSTDATGEVARHAGATVLRHPFNLGYGGALQTGYKYALERGSSLLVQMDADGQHDPRDVSRLCQPVLDGCSDLVLGSRFLGSDYRMSALHGLGRVVFRFVARLFGLTVTDPTSGFQAMNRRVLVAHAADSFPVDYPDVNVLVAASRSGLRVTEEPVEMSRSSRGSTLHGGLRSVYYVYKMVLSTWAALGTPRGGRGPGVR